MAGFASPDRFPYSFERPVDLLIMPGLGAFHEAGLMFVFGNEAPREPLEAGSVSRPDGRAGGGGGRR